MLRSRKAVIEIQFNWIFILIVGALIMTFFIVVVQKQKQIHDTRIQTTVQADLNAILSGAEVSTGTAHKINIPEATISYDCEGYKSGNQKPFKSRFAFAPSSVKTRELITWAYEWDVPYKVGNFLMTTSPNVYYIIVYDPANAGNSNLAKLINRTLPDEVSKTTVKIADISSYQNKNNAAIRFISIKTPTFTMHPSIASKEDGEVSLVNITPINGLFFGNITFYRKNGNAFERQGTSPYLGNASLYGSLFTDEQETYNCAMQKAYRQLGYTTNISYSRAKFIMDYYAPLFSPCSTDTTIHLKPIIEESSKGFSYSSAKTINQQAANIRIKNSNLISYSCPTIY
jgi:hypothetical protein